MAWIIRIEHILVSIGGVYVGKYNYWQVTDIKWAVMRAALFTYEKVLNYVEPNTMVNGTWQWIRRDMYISVKSK